YLFNLPSTYALDTTVCAVSTNGDSAGGSRVGYGSLANTTSANTNYCVDLAAYMYDTTHVCLQMTNAGLNLFQPVGSTYFSYSNSPLYITFRASIPISGWTNSN
ncbi:MAG: hypothetical protein ACXWQJ_14110, partial [Bdellovibrionota bacterium]